MTNENFLQSFENLQKEVQELKILQQRVLLYLENKSDVNPYALEERISVKETCRILGISEVTCWKLRKNKILPFTRHNRNIRFKKIDVLNYLNQIK